MTNISGITVNVSVWTYPQCGRVVAVLTDPISNRPTVSEVDIDG